MRSRDVVQVRICIVHPGNGWILSRIAHELANTHNRLDEKGVEQVLPADHWAEITPTEWLTGPGPSVDDPPFEAIFYIDVQSCYGAGFAPAFKASMPDAKHIGFFTHADQDDVRSIDPVVGTLDGIVHMAQREGARFTSQTDYPPEQMAVIHPGQVHDRFPLRPLRLGVCQRGGFPGKGDPFLFEALVGLPEAVRGCIEVFVKGTGWRESAERYASRLLPLQLRLNEGEDVADYPRFYEAIDYLLIPSLWEGGPLALQEALACGVPVIAADVGFVRDFLQVGHNGDQAPRHVAGCRIFQTGNAMALQAVLQYEVEQRRERRRQVEHLTWANYAERLEMFIRGLQ